MSPSANYSSKLSLFLFCSLFVLAVILPAQVHAADDLEVSGWIPYWATSKGTRDAMKHLSDLDVIHPFGFTIKRDGALHDAMGLKKSAWRKLFKSADSKNVLVIPTVTSGDGALVHTILSDEDLRKDHIEAIVAAVKKGKFDGIDIDYEGKRSETKDYFSLFLKELKEELDGKILSCAIEARTPPESLYKVIPATIAYANDYAAIGTYCDRIELMTYDQRRADIKLNESKAGEPYMPLADTDWVRKVAEFAVQNLPKEKLVLGIPTYGHQYEITVVPNWYRDYSRVGAINPPSALKMAKKEKVTPSRNRGGELSFSYATKAFSRELRSASLQVPEGTTSGNLIAARALAYANTTGSTAVINYVTWSDAESIRTKVELARELGLLGVAFFKFDGEEDPDMWDVLSD